MSIKNQYPEYTFSKFYKDHKGFVIPQVILLILGITFTVISHIYVL